MPMNFNDALNTKVADIEKPPLLPIGTFICVVEKQPTMSVIADGRFEVVDFILKVLSAGEDVDPAEIKAYGNVTKARLRHRFLFSTEEDENFKRTEWNLRRFLEDHLQVVDKGATTKQALNASVNAQCTVEVIWRPDKNDPETQYAQVNKTAPVE